MTVDLAKLDADLRNDEGYRVTPYLDTMGNDTIGIGHRCSAAEIVDYEAGLSDAAIEALYHADRAAALAFLDHALPWWTGLPEPAGRGLANMSFQLRGRLLGFTAMLGCLEANDWTGAAGEAMSSLWARQVPARATRIAALYRSCAPPPVGA